MKIPFTLEAWLKDKSQKVETRDGLAVTDIHLTKYRDENVVVYYVGRDMWICGEEGNVNIDKTECKYDLFIVTPEEELTEFEKKLWEVLKSEGSPIGPIEKFTDDDKRVFHAYAAKLLALAIDTRANELFGGLIQSELDKDSIHYDLIEFMCNLYDCQNWKEIEETAEAYVTRIKAAAMKDLPRWNESRGVFRDGWINDGFLYYKSHSIQLSSLEKLPGFKEDESHE